REREEEREERPELEAAGEPGRRRELAENLEVERAGPAPRGRLERKARREDRHQHEQRPDERVEDELDRRVDPVAAAPDPDDQVHGDEDDLPEDVEEEQVE